MQRAITTRAPGAQAPGEIERFNDPEFVLERNWKEEGSHPGGVWRRSAGRLVWRVGCGVRVVGRGLSRFVEVVERIGDVVFGAVPTHLGVAGGLGDLKKNEMIWQRRWRVRRRLFLSLSHSLSSWGGPRVKKAVVRRCPPARARRKEREMQISNAQAGDGREGAEHDRSCLRRFMSLLDASRVSGSALACKPTKRRSPQRCF